MSILLFAIGIFTLLAVSIVFFKTPKEKRTLKYILEERQEFLEKKLQTYPKEREATIVQGNKKQAFIRFIPFVILLIPALIVSKKLNIIFETPIVCNHIQGVNLAVAIVTTSFLMIAIALFLFSLQMAKEGYKIYKYTYVPPLDAIRFHDFIAKKDKNAKLIGVAAMTSPLLVIILNFYGFNSLKNLYNNDVKNILDKKVMKLCKEKNVYKINR
jgi:hypothetical protein